jgi:hypothetical protein
LHENDFGVWGPVLEHHARGRARGLRRRRGLHRGASAAGEGLQRRHMPGILPRSCFAARHA